MRKKSLCLLLLFVYAALSFGEPVAVKLIPDAWTGHCSPVEIDGQKGWQSEKWKDLPSRYFFFDVKDPAFKNGKAPALEIILTCFNTVSVPVTLQYDSTDSSVLHKDGSGAWKHGKTFATDGSGGLKTFTWTVTDAMFANRCGGRDFRISAAKDVDFIIRDVVVRTTGDSTAPVPVAAEPKPSAGFYLPEVFSDNMVLQRETSIPVWGQAEDGTRVTVTFNATEMECIARDGKWRVILPPMPASSEPRTMTVVATHESEIIKRQFTNVLVGDVWLASGQSNMEMQLGVVKGGPEAVAASSNSLLRLFTVSRKLETQSPPVGDAWKISGPDTSAPMSAVAYFFAQEIQKTQGIPVGIINCSYGGTVTETWCSPEVLKKGYPDWETFLANSLKNPDWPRRNTGSVLYTRMLKTVMPFAVKGFIWYQGEGNASRADEQKKLFPAMVADWRNSWGDPSLPFYFVQLARFDQADWHAFRDAQRWISENMSNTYLAVSIDLSRDWNHNNHPIHPTTKAPIGHRLALAARAKVYGETNLVYSGPFVQQMTVKGNAAVLFFKGLGSGLVAMDGQPLRGFYISTDGSAFVQADARIEGDTVTVSSPDVSNPVAVRYGAEADMGKENLDVNLGNREGLPASPFTISGR